MGLGIYITPKLSFSGGGGAPPPSYDADATAYLNAVGILNDSTLYGGIAGSAIWTAFDTWFTDTKADGLYNDIIYFYPCIGTTASEHKWNAVNPLDTDAAYRLTFGGGATFSMNGVQWNGTNSYAETHLNPSTDYTSTNSFAIGHYSRTSAAVAQSIEQGLYKPGGFNENVYLWTQRSSDNQCVVKLATGTDFSSAVITNGLGLFHAQRSSSTANQVWQNTTKIINDTSITSVGLPNGDYPLGAYRNTSTGLSYWSNREVCCYYLIDRHLSDSEYTNWEANMLALNTALSRNV